MTRASLLALILPLAALGAILVIFGAVYTVLGCTADNVFRGYPIWSPPNFNGILACGNLTSSVGRPNGISVNYSLNYLGVAILAATAAVSFPLRKTIRHTNNPSLRNSRVPSKT